MSGTLRSHLFVALMLPCSAFAAPDVSLELEGVTVSLGAAKANVLAQFKDRYVTSQITGSDTWGIATRSKEDFRLIGYITFKGERVTKISKRWSDYFVDTRGPEAFRSFHAAISHFVQDGRTRPIISTYRKQEPGLSADTVVFNFGRRTLTVTLFESADLGSGRLAATIDEELAAE